MDVSRLWYRYALFALPRMVGSVKRAAGIENPAARHGVRLWIGSGVASTKPLFKPFQEVLIFFHFLKSRLQQCLGIKPVWILNSLLISSRSDHFLRLGSNCIAAGILLRASRLVLLL